MEISVLRIVRNYSCPLWTKYRSLKFRGPSHLSSNLGKMGDEFTAICEIQKLNCMSIISRPWIPLMGKLINWYIYDFLTTHFNIILLSFHPPFSGCLFFLYVTDLSHAHVMYWQYWYPPWFAHCNDIWYVIFSMILFHNFWCGIHLWFRLMGGLQAKSMTSLRYF